MNWIKDNRYTNIFTCEKYFGKYKYLIEISVEEKPKTIRFWVNVSSGKKRKELSVLGNKENKSFGGIKALSPSIITLANNHILDQGVQGLNSTMKTLNKKRINK